MKTLAWILVLPPLWSPALAQTATTGAKNCPTGQTLRCAPRTIMRPEARTVYNCNGSYTSCQRSATSSTVATTDMHCTCQP